MHGKVGKINKFKWDKVKQTQSECVVKVKQCKARKITKVRANKSKAKQGKCKPRQSREGGAEQI